MQAYYQDRIDRMALRKIHLRTLWLAAEDYPLLLGSADLGICLHKSSSGLDIPMKLADLLGSGVPVCAYHYGSCLSERLRHGENGLLFSTSDQLAAQLYDLFKGFPEDATLLNQLRRNVLTSSNCGWTEGWNREALPTFQIR